ncbi:hypothetical protein [Paramaledivibacter caminithermalis]|jgi:hypothetical protein|nr:hypothetical protein [Paramaledivibacter caminithermalis]
MSDFTSSIKQIHNLQEKLDDVSDLTSVTEVLAISQEIDTLIRANE